MMILLKDLLVRSMWILALAMVPMLLEGQQAAAPAPGLAQQPAQQPAQSPALVTEPIAESHRTPIASAVIRRQQLEIRILALETEYKRQTEQLQKEWQTAMADERKLLDAARADAKKAPTCYVTDKFEWHCPLPVGAPAPASAPAAPAASDVPTAKK